MNHDDLVTALAATRGRTARVPDRLLLYRQHPRNVAGTDKTLLEAARSQGDLVAAFEHKAAAARQWAGYFGGLVDPARQGATEAYYLAAARVMELRVERLRSRWPEGLPSLVHSLSRGDYSASGPECLGWKALLQDILWFCRHQGAPRGARSG